ncbi:N-6 DNA methylase [Larkinella terrae]|uniref:site-specific DNA-methyltransferase (adenine-specific) n=1 Tax=Larkinella terrae TaxID=2025311 RepID=A0A7K0EPK9_9BACT|nr:N-6 DNA methylase [Larkinella terrae]MRS63368.1 N-6 DNA methylase [Larkinella terrae]
MAKGKRAESRTRYIARLLSSRRGWNIAHLSKGGDFLEEQEITGHFPDIGLGQDRPDFLVCLGGEPKIVIEAKNEIRRANQAIEEAIEYAEQINATGKYSIKIAVGIAGEEDNGFLIIVKYKKNSRWDYLKSGGYQLTSIPSRREVELALEADDSTTNVTVPSSAEFIDAAIELSVILRHAKIEAPLRPKVIGAIVTALYQGEIDVTTGNELESINNLVHDAITESVDLGNKKQKLEDALHLTGNDYERLSPKIQRIISILKRLNVRSVLQTDTDFLGMFYEAFLRYGYDNNALGIVFTPRHITRFCVDLIDARITDRVIDIASGTGGFLVAAFDKMMATARGPKAIEKVKQSLYGYDTNPTVWALATLNMFFRGDGKSHIENANSLDEESKANVAGQFTRAFLNPPFSQEGEPERDFIDAALDSLEPEGILAVVVAAGIFADEDNAMWRNKFIRSHTLLGVISLPEDLFYPTAAPSSIMIAKAHIPQDENENVFMGRIWNDGFNKLKGKRVEAAGSQIPELLRCFDSFKRKQQFTSELVITIKGSSLLNGQEFSPQQWLPQPELTEREIELHEQNLILSLFQAISSIPELADEVLEDPAEAWKDFPDFPLSTTRRVSDFFSVYNGKSSGEKNYTEGNCPYISSGDTQNSIIRLVQDEESQVFANGGITVTAFGQAYIQPWRFMARGNGGSSVRILVPKFNMSLNEMLWFAAQINIQKWRFFYARMSIKSRLERLEISSPSKRIPDEGMIIADRISSFREQLFILSKLKKE